jgi:hypothetical protein
MPLLNNRREIMSKSEMELIRLAKEVVERAEKDAELNPSTEEIEILVVEPNKKPYQKTVKNDFKAKQEIVEGYIESVTIGKGEGEARICMIINEEGKILNLPANRKIMNFDIIAGTFLITSYNYKGECISLTAEQIKRYKKIFAPMEVYL